MEIKISERSYEQLEEFRKSYYKNTEIWLQDYNAIINVMSKMINHYVEGV